MAIPLSAYDREVIDAGYKFIPQTQYLLNPFQIPTAPSIMDPVQKPIASGITSLQSQGRGALQAGDINYNDFAKLGFDAYSRRQPTPLVDDLYQSKLDKSFFGFPSYTEQELTGPDMGEYIASNTDIPLELTKAGQLQSGLSSIGKGITGLASKMKGGPLTSIITMLLGGDKFDTLPALDQQFIEQSMGYRGPTIFGENTSGLYKDPFGVNTRSLRGNYAEKVRDDFSGLTDSLTGRLSDKYGATFNTETGMFESDDEEAAKKANKMTEMMRKKYNFRQKQINQQEFDKKIADQQKKAEAQRIKDELAAAAAAKDKAAALAAIKKQGKADYNPGIHGPNNYGKDSGGNQSFDFGGGFGIGSDGGPVSNKTGKGRTGYINGGIVDILDIYY